jgi:hypothetical protein
MTLNKFVFKTHKWLAVGVALATVVWFITGVALIVPPRLLRGAEARAVRADLPSFEDARVTIPQAIAAMQAAAGAPVKAAQIAFQRLPGKLLYEISATNGKTYFVDALSGDPFVVNETTARQLAENFLAGRGQVVEVTLEKRYTVDHHGGPLPYYRVRADDPEQSTFFFANGAGGFRVTTRLDRILGMFHGAHTFAILRPWLPGAAVRALALLMTVAGTVMSFFGVWILWLQWQNWWNARKARAARAA